MSGGSMNYLYGRVQDAEFVLNTSLRVAFKRHLQVVGAALKAIEWNDSGDGDDDEDHLIRKCVAPAETLQAAIDAARAAYDQLGNEIVRAVTKKEAK